MGKIKIVRIIARLNIGGPAVNASILSSGLDKEEFTTKVIYGSLAKGEGDLGYLMRQAGVDMELVPELGREISPFDDLIAFFKIIGIIRRERPDIVHTHTAKAGTLGRLAAIVCGVKVKIHTFHGNIFRGYFGPIKTNVFLWIERFLGALTDKVIVLSEKQKDEIVNEFRIVPEKKCVIVPLGLDFARLRNYNEARTDLRKELGLGVDDVLVGILGRLVPIKNHRMFLEAASRVSKKRPDLKIKYAVIGDGELRAELETAAASLGVGDVVYFLGWRNDLANIYRNLDIVALTSINEGTPLAFLEAMVAGKPAISTDVGGVGDIVSNGVNGIVVGKDDLAGFVDALIRLAGDKGLRERLGTEGAKRSAGFDKERLVGNMASLYRVCVKNK